MEATRPAHVVPVLRGPATSRLEAASTPIASAMPDTTPFDWAACCERILAAAVPPRSDGAVITAVGGPAAVCAAYLAAATGRPLQVVDNLDDVARAPLDGVSRILVAVQDALHDSLLFGLLDQVSATIEGDRPWREIARVTLVTGRDLASLSWMVAKLVLAARRPPAGSVRLRHYSPDHDRSNVTRLDVGGEGEAIQRATMLAPALLESYAEPADVMAFRTHGSEACANGGAGTVFCGLQLLGATFEPDVEGVLACGRGRVCPRGPHPVPLERMAADVLMVETCNGLRLADSRTLPEFNFALSFIDGPGVAYVSSAFTSIGGGAASRAFLAAMAAGCTLGEASWLVNALISRAQIERTAYVAIGDAEHRTRPPTTRGAPLALDTLPAVVDLGDAHFVEITIADAALVERARRGRLAFAVSVEGQEDAPYFFHRVEQRTAHDGAASGPKPQAEGEVLAVCLFRFPRALGRARIEATDPEAWRDRARAGVDAVTRWCDLFRLVGLDTAAPDEYAELRASGDEARILLAQGCTLLTVDGSAAARMARRLQFIEELCLAAAEAAFERIVPKLEGSFWPSNLRTSEHSIERSEHIPCPHCHLSALRRTLRHVLSGVLRRIVVCPRCGICSDTTQGSAIADVRIEAPSITTAGQEMRVSVVTQLARAAILLVSPRLSTHDEPAPPPTPDRASARIVEEGTSRLDFVFQVPEKLSPHRHYVKVLLATADGPAFASRPFFVRAGHTPSADPPVDEERS
ncbi:MAG: hypothetical protein QM820_34865 [Minicystis sp.]